MGHGTMASDTSDLNVSRVHAGKYCTRAIADGSCRKISTYVVTESVVRQRKPGKQAVSDHSVRSAADLFGWLSYGHNGTFPSVLQGGECFKGAKPDSHMEIMSACMHHRCLRSVISSDPDSTGKWETGGLPYKQCIHIGT